MEHLSSPRLREVADTARSITTSIVAANVEAEDRDGRWPAPAMKALAAAGLTGLTVPEELGGHGQGLTGLVCIAEILAQESPSTALCFAMHCVGTAVLAAKATDHQKQHYLEPIAHGRHLTTLALSEPGSGSHFWLPETGLTATDGGYVIEGTKSFVTSGGHADSYVVSTAAAEARADEGAFSCIVLDAGTPGVRWGEPWLGFGMRSNSSRTLHLEGARVPAANLLGAHGDQLWYVFEVVAPYFLMAMAGTYLGVAGASLEIAREHVGRRRHTHSGELLGSNPVVAHRLGRLWIEYERTRRFVFAAAARGDAGDADALVAVLGAKAAAAETAVDLANEAMTLVGGIGYGQNSKLARMLRDARASHVMAPTTDVLQSWVGRALLKLPLLQ